MLSGAFAPAGFQIYPGSKPALPAARGLRPFSLSGDQRLPAASLAPASARGSAAGTRSCADAPRGRGGDIPPARGVPVCAVATVRGFAGQENLDLKPVVFVLPLFSLCCLRLSVSELWWQYFVPRVNLLLSKASSHFLQYFFFLQRQNTAESNLSERVDGIYRKEGSKAGLT